MKCQKIRQFFKLCLIFGLVFKATSELSHASTNLESNLMAGVSLKNIHFLKKSSRSELEESLKQLILREETIKNYDVYFTGIEPVRSSYVNQKISKSIVEDLIKLEELYETSSFTTTQQKKNLVACKTYIDESINAFQNIRDEINTQFYLREESKLIRQAKIKMYSFYFMTLSIQMKRYEDVHEKGLITGLVCIKDKNIREKIYQTSFQLVQSIDAFSMNNYGVPNLSKLKSLTTELAKLNLEKNSVRQALTDLVIESTITLGGAYIGLGTLKLFYDLSRKSVLIYQYGISTLHSGAIAYNDFSKMKINIFELAADELLMARSSTTLRKIINNADDIELGQWIKFTSIYEQIQFEEYLAGRAEVKRFGKCESICSKDTLEKLSEKNQRNMKEITFVLGNYF